MMFRDENGNPIICCILLSILLIFVFIPKNSMYRNFILINIKEKVYEANMLLPKYNLITFTWGNVSGIDRESGYIAIKPSGVEYEDLTPEKMVIVDLNGNIVEGNLKPSSDTPTHIELYKAFSD